MDKNRMGESSFAEWDTTLKWGVVSARNEKKNGFRQLGGWESLFSLFSFLLNVELIIKMISCVCAPPTPPYSLTFSVEVTWVVGWWQGLTWLTTSIINWVISGCDFVFITMRLNGYQDAISHSIQTVSVKLFYFMLVEHCDGIIWIFDNESMTIEMI